MPSNFNKFVDPTPHTDLKLTTPLRHAIKSSRYMGQKQFPKMTDKMSSMRSQRRQRYQYYLLEILSTLAMDFLLEEEMIDLLTFCLQNPSSADMPQKKARITEIGKELFADGGVDALENMFFALENRIKEEIGQDPRPFRSLWNENSTEWNY